MVNKKIQNIKDYIEGLTDFKYINNDNIYFTIKHLDCGFTHNKTIEYLRKKPNIQCPFCSGRKYNTETFKRKVNELDSDFVVKSEYFGTDKPIKLLHKVCGRIITMKPHDFINGNRCKYCSHPSEKKSQEQFTQEVNSIWGEEYSIIGNYNGVKNKIKIKHNVCGTVFYSSPRTLLKGENACKCKQTKTLSNTKCFINKVTKIVGNEYIVLGEYENATSKILLQHNVCGNKFKTSPHKFLTGHTRCSFCNGSKGEKEVEMFLKSKNIEYKREYTFNDCRFKKVLPFDFAIFKNQKIIAVIEYNGEQHYHPSEFFGGTDEFKNRIRNDKIKKEYCKKNNIIFMEIPYTKFNYITKILEKFQKDCSL